MKKPMLVSLFSLSLVCLAGTVAAADNPRNTPECELDWRFDPQASSEYCPETTVPASSPAPSSIDLGSRRRINMKPLDQKPTDPPPEYSTATQISPPQPQPPSQPVKPPVQRLSGITLQHVHFDSGSIRLDREAVAELTELGNYLKKKSHIMISVNGHTDVVGSAEANQRLSEQRAEAVRQFLEDLGVSSQQMISQGFGESRLLSEFGVHSRRQRRVELLPR